MMVVCVLAACVILAGGPQSPSSSDAPSPFAPTHTLRMHSADENEAVPGNVRLVTSDSITRLILQLPDDSRFEAECVQSSSGDFKFQLVRIANKKIVTIQFVGTGSPDSLVTGKFTGMVDGELRPDMSGTFELVVKDRGTADAGK
jgi:hypothetical protein